MAHLPLKYRLSPPEVAQLQQVMLGEPLPQSKVTDPPALVDLIGKGLVRLEHGFYWPEWSLIPKSSV
jgi:hypothetical protein